METNTRQSHTVTVIACQCSADDGCPCCIWTGQTQDNPATTVDERNMAAREKRVLETYLRIERAPRLPHGT